MKQTAQQTQKRERGFKYHFARSTYITAVWNWFMMFAAAACEAILTSSVIYSCARLLPALHTPLWLDNTVFIWQMVALDVGGLSLRKMANQAYKDGNEKGAQFAGHVSNALITILILNVVLSVLQGVAKLDAQVVSVVEGILLVARAVMAVLYAAVIHALREDHPDENQNIPATDVEQMIGQAIMDLQTEVEQRLAAITSDQSRILATVQQGQQTSPAIGDEALLNNVVEVVMQRLEQQFDAYLQQHVTVAPLSEMPLLEKPKSVALNAKKAPSNIVALPQKQGTKQRNTTVRENKTEVIFALLDENPNRKPPELASLAECDRVTAWRALQRWQRLQGETDNATVTEGNAM